MFWVIHNVAQHLGACADPLIRSRILPPAACDNVLDAVHSCESPGNVPTRGKVVTEDRGPTKDGMVRLEALGGEEKCWPKAPYVEWKVNKEVELWF